MLLFASRWIIGGLVIALIPIVASRYSPKVAGILLLIPLITIISVLVVNYELGKEALFPMVKFSLLSVVPLIAFLSVLYVGLYKTTVVLALLLASLIWLLVAYICLTLKV